MTYLPPTKNSNATFMSFFITDLWNSTKKVPYWGLTEKINLPSTWKTRDGGRKLRAVPLPRSPLTSALPNRQRSTTPRLQLPSWCAKAAFFVKTTKRIKDGFVWRFNWLHIYIEYVYMYSGSMYIYIYIYTVHLHDHQILKNPNILHLHVGNNPKYPKALASLRVRLGMRWDGINTSLVFCVSTFFFGKYALNYGMFIQK